MRRLPTLDRCQRRLQFLRRLHSGLAELPSRLPNHFRPLRFEPLEIRLPLAAHAPSFSDTEVITWQGNEVEVRRGEWIVQVDDVRHSNSDGLDLGPLVHGTDARIHAIANNVGQLVGSSGHYLFEFGDVLPPDVALDVLSMTRGLQYAEPNFVVSTDAIPNDPDFAQLWGLEDQSDNDIDAPEAWDLTTGSSSVVVGVIDTGVDYTHEDLAANMWFNAAECAAGVGNCIADGVDDDNNGYVDDFYGWDFVNNDNDPFDDHSHGTHVAGTIAAVGNNATGVAGVTWNTKIMALKFLAASGSGSTAGAIEAIEYATMMKRDHGVDIRLTNNSWGGGGFSQSLYDAIEESRQEDMLFIAAAGNDSSDTDTSPHYPSSYDHGNVIAVASTTSSDSLSSFSNTGLISVDLGAPGSSIYSTVPGDQYGYKSGTSMASPHVAGVSALAWSTDANASYTDIRDAILGSVDLVASLDGKTVTGGRLNANGALGQMGLFATSVSPGENEVLSVAPTQFTVDFSDPIDAGSLDAADFMVGGIAGDGFTLVDADTVEFTFATSPVTTEGPQVIEIAAGSILRASDGDGVATLTSQFYYDPTPLQVVSITPADGSVLTLPAPVLRVDFTEAVAPGSLGLADLVLNSGRVDEVTIIDADTVEYKLAGLDREVPLQVSLASGAVTDAFGIPNQPFAANYVLDIVSAEYPGSIDVAAPLGALVYRSSLGGNWHSASDTESFTIDLEANQTLSALLTPDASDTTGDLIGRLKVIDPGSTDVFDQSGTSVVGGSPQAILMQTEPIDSAGVWTFTLESVGASGGQYTLDYVIGAAYEEESVGLGSNDTRLAAQSLDSAWTSLDSNSNRNAVSGSVAAETDSDWYEVSLLQGEATTLSLQSADADWPLSLSLHEDDGTEIISAVELAGAMRIDKFLDNTQSGTYYAQVSAGTGGTFSGPIEYMLAMTTNATLDNDGLDTDANGTLATAQSLRDFMRVGGYVGRQLASSAGQAAIDEATAFDPAELTEIEEGRFLPTSWLRDAQVVQQDGQTQVSFAAAQDPRILMGEPRVSEHFVSINSAPEGDFIRDAVYTPDGTRLLMAHRESQNILVINVATGVVEADIAVQGQPVDLELTPDGAHLLSANTSGDTVSVIRLSDFTKLADIATSAEWPYRVHVTPDSAQAVVATADDRFVVISLATLAEVRSFHSPGLGATTVRFTTAKSSRLGFGYSDFVLTPDLVSPKLITPATNDAESSARIYDIGTGSQLANIPVSGWRPSITITADGLTAYATSNSLEPATITEIDVATGVASSTVTTAQLWNYETLLTPDGLYMIGGALNETLFLDLSDGSTSATLFTGSVADMELTHDGQYLLARQVIDVSAQTIVGSLPSFYFLDYVKTSPTSLAGVQIGSLVLDHYSLIDIGAAPTAGPDTLGGSAPEGDTPDSIAITPDGLLAVTANYDSNNVSIIDMQTESVLAWVDVGDKADRVTITPDGSTALVTSTTGDTLTLVDLSSYSVVASLPGFSAVPRDVVVSADGSEAFVVTTGASDQTDKIYFVELSGATSSVAGSIDIGNAANGTYRFTRLTLSPDGSLLAVPVSRDNEVVLIDTATRTEVARVATGGFPERIVFSPDGGFLYSLNSTGESISVVKVAGVNSATVGQVTGITYPYGLAIDDEGRYLYTVSYYDQLVRVVDTESRSIVASVPIESNGRVVDVMLVDNVLYMLGGEPIPLQIPLNDDNGHLMRVFANGPESRFVDDVLLSGRVRGFAYSQSLRSVATISYNNDGVDLVEYSSQASGDEDFYRFLPQVGDNITITAAMPGTAIGLFDNGLNYALELYNPSRELLASSDGGPILHTAASIGEHFIRVYAQDLTRGEYTIAVDGVTELVGPSILTTSPVDDATDLPLDTTLRVTFDEAVVAAAGSISIRRAADDSLLESFASTSPSVAINGATVNISPTVPWELATEYYVLIDAGTFNDVDGDPFAGLSDPTLWSFTLGFGFDFGDAPAPYPVAHADGGPRHSLVGPTLGAQRDSELDGVPSAAADGDDAAGISDDEDGISQGVINVGDAGAELTVNVTATGQAFLDTWVDFNGDGIWGSAGEQIFASEVVVDGENTLTFAVPAWVHPGEKFARFRISTAGGLAVTGNAPDGEVEDHVITISPSAAASNYFSGVNSISQNSFGYESLSVGDIDGDGDPDLVSGKGTGSDLVWFENDGSGGLDERIIHSVEQTNVVAVDMDADGDLDIASLRRWNNEVQWFENTGTGSFDVNPIETLSAVSLTDLEALDFDRDGDIDLLVADTFDDNVYLYENDGSEAFTRSLLLTGVTIRNISAGDFDRDGDFDLLTTHLNGAHQHLNTASGWVTTELTASSIGNTQLTDLDNDGDLDLVNTEFYGINWWENVGGDFQTPIVITTSPSLLSTRIIRAADLDGDGDMDLVGNGFNANGELAWYQNDGEQNFTPHLFVHAGGISANDLVVWDYDGDGDLDLSTSEYSGGVGLFENINGQPPEVILVSPPHNDAVIDPETDLTIVFDQPVLPSGGQITIWDATNDVSVEVMSVTESNVSIVENLVAINPTLDFTPATTYEVRISAGALRDLDGDSFPGLESGQWRFVTAESGLDYGDAPDPAAGTAALDYNTTAADGGASHVIVPGLHLGYTVDADDGSLQSPGASADDASVDDEDGLNDPVNDLLVTIGTQPTVNARVTNTTSFVATLSGWIDYNNNGVFETTERGQISVPSGTHQQLVTLVLPWVPGGYTGSTHARFRLGTDATAQQPIGDSNGGEVEDYNAKILAPSFGAAVSAAKIGHEEGGGPTLIDQNHFGSAVAPLGDVNGDGIVDLAIGAYGDNTDGTRSGAVYVAMMNADGSINTYHKLTEQPPDHLPLRSYSEFGKSLAPAGDLDHDGVNDLVAGATFIDYTSEPTLNFVYLNSDGTVKDHQYVIVDVEDSATRIESVTAIGDLDGDGISEFAVGTPWGEIEGRETGAVYIMFLNPDGTKKRQQLITDAVSGGPALNHFDGFGASVTSVGDLDSDGIPDLAVGAKWDDTGFNGSGAVYLLFLNSDGTVRGHEKIAHQTGGGPTLDGYDSFGSSLATVGDLNADGIHDLVVGASDEDTGLTGAGAAFVLFLNSDGTAQSHSKLASNIGGVPALSIYDAFGSSIASIGDLNGDGTMDLAVGASGDDGGGSGRGSVHLLFLEPMPYLDVSVDANSIAENGGTATGTVTRNQVDDITQPLTVSLASGDTSEATVPTDVTIPANEVSADFIIAAAEDDLLDGSQAVAITASATGFIDGNQSLDVLDHETLILSIAVNSISESGSSTTATVTRSSVGDLSQQLIVNISSDDTSEATVTGTVTIAVGQSISDPFNINIVDDAVLDGIQTATITATAAGYVDGVDTIDVTDNETPPPTVTDVIIAGSTWDGTFIDGVDGGGIGAGNGIGFSLVGAHQLNAIPWDGVDRIYIMFNEDVSASLADGDVAVAGTDSGSVALSPLSYAPATNIATIPLGSPLTRDRFVISLSSSGILDAVGNQLDGEWTSLQTLPSGNGTPGGQFDFFFNVLPGDANADGSVNGGDLPAFSASFNRSVGSAEYDMRADWNSDGSVNGGDLPPFSQNFNRSLPNDDPPQAVFAPSGAPQTSGLDSLAQLDWQDSSAIEDDDDYSLTYPMDIEPTETSGSSESSEWETRSSDSSGDDFPGVSKEDDDGGETDEVLDVAITQLFGDNTP